MAGSGDSNSIRRGLISIRSLSGDRAAAKIASRKVPGPLSREEMTAMVRSAESSDGCGRLVLTHPLPRAASPIRPTPIAPTVWRFSTRIAMLQNKYLVP
jgi:hypothetical protein